MGCGSVRPVGQKTAPAVLAAPRGVSHRKLVKTVGIYILTRASEEGFYGWLDEWAAFEEALDSCLCENAVADLKASEADPTRLKTKDLSDEELRIVLKALDN